MKYIVEEVHYMRLIFFLKIDGIKVDVIVILIKVVKWIFKSLITLVTTQFLTHVLINFQK